MPNKKKPQKPLQELTGREVIEYILAPQVADKLDKMLGKDEPEASDNSEDNSASDFMIQV